MSIKYIGQIINLEKIKMINAEKKIQVRAIPIITLQYIACLLYMSTVKIILLKLTTRNLIFIPLYVFNNNKLPNSNKAS